MSSGGFSLQEQGSYGSATEPAEVLPWAAPFQVARRFDGILLDEKSDLDDQGFEIKYDSKIYLRYIKIWQCVKTLYPWWTSK